MQRPVSKRSGKSSHHGHQYEVRSALAKCGLTTKHIESQVRVLSGGEQAKVRLCKTIKCRDKYSSVWMSLPIIWMWMQRKN